MSTIALGRIALVATILMATGAAASDPDRSLSAALADLDPGDIASGRLLDRTVPLAAPTELDGDPAAPSLTASRWRQALDDLRRASLQRPDWPADDRIRARASELVARDLVPIAVLDLAYQSLRPDALTTGALTSRDGRLVAASGATSDALFNGHRAVAAAALDPVLHRGSRTRFVVPGDLLITDEPVTLAADFADGRGWRALRPDEPVTVRYPTTGEREIRLRLTGASGEVRWSRFAVDVVALDVPDPTVTWPLTASVPHDGAAASGEAFVYLADGHTEVTAPVVVIEGFDFNDDLDWPELYTLLNQENLLEDLRAAGRDAVVLNFAEATAPIQRNAYLLVELLQTLDAMLPPGATYPVVGASMGGMVGRYALAWLEHEGVGHACDLFVSFDGPQAGAVIPLGLQCWLDFFASESSEAAYLLSRLDTVAARQMLLYHHTVLESGSVAPSPLYDQFRADLAQIGDWPAQPRLVAVVNGSGTGQDQGFAAGAQLVEYEYESLLVDIVGNVWAVPDGSSQLIFDGLIDLIWPLPDTERRVTVQNTLPWDGAPGGSRASLAQMDTTSVPYGDVVALHDDHAFIPTVGALALVGADPFADVGAIADFPPYDAVYVPAENQEHVAITVESKAWFLDEILGTVTSTPTDPGGPPVALRLHGATPNPFNPRTTIGFALPTSGPVRLWIADLRGRRIQMVVDGHLDAGTHSASWLGHDDDGRAVAAGVYLAVVEHGGSRVARRLTLVR
jgi:hypothetical protein